jgi:hypothetical protein
MDAVKRCEELLASAVELNAKRGGQKPEELYEVVYLEDEDVAAIRQILAERAALIAAWPGGICIGSVRPGAVCGVAVGWIVLGWPDVYPARETAVLAAAGIKREGEG